jgi:acetamidase/formamidase
MAKTSVVPAAGASGRTHYFPADRVHFSWDADNEPVLTVGSGDTVVVHTRDVSDNEITTESTADARHTPARPRDDAVLPVQVEGAHFSCGDAHAAQGDREVCVTGIESPMYAALRFTLHEDRSIPARTPPGPLTPYVDSRGFYGTTGVGPGLYVAAQEAVRATIDHLAESYDLSREDAYVRSSLSVDLKISEIVDAGQYVVSAVLPLAVFRDSVLAPGGHEVD